MSTADHVARLAHLASRLGADELRVLLAIAERLTLGAVEYGALDIEHDTRNWRAEASAESLDRAVYLAIDDLKRAEAAARAALPTLPGAGEGRTDG